MAHHENAPDLDATNSLRGASVSVQAHNLQARSHLSIVIQGLSSAGVPSLPRTPHSSPHGESLFLVPLPSVVLRR